MRILRPDGEPFASYTDTANQLQEAKERAEQERQRAEQEQQRAERLAARLRAAGIDPDAV